MTRAMKAVQEGQSISQAARVFGVPKTTLYDRVSGRVQHGTNPGPQSYLNSKEEKELSSYLKHCARVGYGKTRRDVLTIVHTAASEKGVLRTNRISQGWWHQFIERQKDLSLRQGDVTAHVRMDAMNQDTMNHYFSLLHQTLSTHSRKKSKGKKLRREQGNKNKEQNRKPRKKHKGPRKERRNKLRLLERREHAIY